MVKFKDKSYPQAYLQSIAISVSDTTVDVYRP